MLLAVALQRNGLGLVIVLDDVSFDRLNEVLDRAEATSADGLGGDLGEPSLYLVDPGTTRRSRMQHVMWASSKPVAHPGSFVSGKVIQDQMNRSWAGRWLSTRFMNLRNSSSR